MKTFCTKIDRPDGVYSGPILSANTWEQAEALAAERGAWVSGEFGFQADMSGNVLLVGTAILGESRGTEVLEILGESP
jgi:hypothetical protein